MKFKQINLFKGSLALAMAGSLLAVGQAKADYTVTLYQNSYSYSDGGEFDAVFSPSGQSTEVFCNEVNTEFNPGTQYTYKMVQTDSEGYTLTLGEAFLYNAFVSGTLAGYNYTSPATRQADAGLLQAALWTLSGQSLPNSDYVVPTKLNNPFYALAYATLADPTAANAGRYPVEIMQLYSGSTPAQAQLVPAPEVPMTDAMMFGGLALGGYGLLRRKSVLAAQT